MSKAWIIETTWTRPTSSVRERYVVARADSEEAVRTLHRVLALSRGSKIVVEGPLADADYYRLGLSPGMVLRIGRDARAQ